MTRPRHPSIPLWPALVLALAALAGAALAQAPTLALDAEHVYLSDISRHLEGLSSYRQRFASEVKDAAGEVTSRYAWTNEVAGDERRTEEENVTPYFTTRSAALSVGGQAFSYTEMQGEASCQAAPAFDPPAPAITVSDVTGFQTATLEQAGETVAGVAADRYRLEPPADNPYYDPASLQGELWLAREGYLVKFEIQAENASGTTTWSYALSEVGALPGVELPDACGAL